MPVRLQYPRLVQFHETDLAGIAHFSWYFRYMEEAEHALWRELGMSIWPAGATVGYPRVSATCDFKAPLRFEDQFVVDIEVDAVGQRSIRYRCTLIRGGQVMAVGSMTAACVTQDEDGRVRPIAVPDSVRARLTTDRLS